MQLRPHATTCGSPASRSGREIPGAGERASDDAGSIIIVVATDAPLLPHQLKRLARRASLGLGAHGSVAGNGSGDIFIAFSTANPGAAKRDRACGTADRCFPTTA